MKVLHAADHKDKCHFQTFPRFTLPEMCNIHIGIVNRFIAFILKFSRQVSVFKIHKESWVETSDLFKDLRPAKHEGPCHERHLMDIVVADIPHFIMIQAFFYEGKHSVMGVKTSQKEVHEVWLLFIQILEGLILI